MLPLGIGLLIFAAATAFARATQPQRRHPSYVAVAVGLAVLLQIFVARHSFTHYKFTLLGLRYRLIDAATIAVRQPLVIGGDPATADVAVPGARTQPIGRLVPVGDSVVRAVLVEPLNGGALVLRRNGERHVVGSVALGEGSTVAVRGQLGSVTLTVQRGGSFLARRWGIQNSTTGRTVDLPRIPVKYGTHTPSVAERTYPLADVLDQSGDSALASSVFLASFFYYDDDDHVRFVPLDSEVTSPKAAVDTLWAPALGGADLQMTALPHRDYPSLRDSLPGRGGLRSLMTVRSVMRGPWMDLSFVSPEMVTLDTGALSALSHTATRERPYSYSVRFSGVKETKAREAVTFASPSRRFEAGSQAIFRLPSSPATKEFSILTPTGIAAWQGGVPFALGDGRFEEIVRVDGQGTSLTFWLVATLLLIVIPFALFRLRSISGRVAALALAVYGLGALRLLLGFSAFLASPYSLEALQSGLLMINLLVWTVLTSASRADPANRWSAVELATVLIGVMCAAFAYVAYANPDANRPSMSQLVLAGIPVLVLCIHHFPDAVDRFAKRASSLGARFSARVTTEIPDGKRIRDRVRRLGLNPAEGFIVGASLLAIRFLLRLVFSLKESLVLPGGTRFAFSTIYTPLALIALAWVIVQHCARVRAAATPEVRTIALRRMIFDVWSFLAFAFGITALVISDLGIALATQFGVLLYLIIVGWRWMYSGMRTIPLILALSFPVSAEFVLQRRPELGLEGADAAARTESQDWTANDLRLLAYGDPQAVRLIGQQRSEIVGIMYETISAYVNGPWRGPGFLTGKVSDELRATATREHVPSALVLGQWGLAGAAGLVLLLLALLSGAPPPRDRTRATRQLSGGQLAVYVAIPTISLTLVMLLLTYTLPLGNPLTLLVTFILAAIALWFALGHQKFAPSEPIVGLPTSVTLVATELFLFTLAFASLYIVLANCGLVLFTGKNVYFLGLDSVGDVLESLVLLAGAAWGIGRVERARAAEATS